MNGVVFALYSTLATAALAQSVPSAISADPQPDREHPAKMTVVHIPSHGVSIKSKF